MGKSTLFIDESGKSGLFSDEKEPFIMTGVILDNQEIDAIEGFFTYIKRKYGIDDTKPFHSYHIFENEETKLIDSKLIDLAKTLAEYISLIPIQLTIIKIDKKTFKEAIGLENAEQCSGSKEKKNIPELPYKVLASQLFKWFTDYLEDNDHIGQIVVDSRRGGDHELLETFHLYQEGHSHQVSEEMSEIMKERITAICFADKNFLSGGLEITDLLSYVTFFRVRELLTQNEHIGIPIIWNEIKNKKALIEYSSNDIRELLGIEEGEVYKDLK